MPPTLEWGPSEEKRQLIIYCVVVYAASGSRDGQETGLLFVAKNRKTIENFMRRAQGPVTILSDPGILMQQFEEKIINIDEITIDNPGEIRVEGQ